jgi:hypothetical protein
MFVGGCDSQQSDARNTGSGACKRHEDGAWAAAAQRECFRSFPKQTISGYWVAALEASQFYTDRTSALAVSGSDVWLELSPEVRASMTSTSEPGAQVFEVRFEGRRPELPGPFGHFGMYGRLVYVERFLQLSKISPSSP